MRMSWKVQNVIKCKEKGNMRHETSATAVLRRLENEVKRECKK